MSKLTVIEHARKTFTRKRRLCSRRECSCARLCCTPTGGGESPCTGPKEAQQVAHAHAVVRRNAAQNLLLGYSLKEAANSLELRRTRHISRLYRRPLRTPLRVAQRFARRALNHE